MSSIVPSGMDKRIAVICGDQVQDAIVLPGTTARDVLNQLGVSREFCLGKRDGLPFGDTEAIFDQVRSGEKLYASPPADVG